MKNAIASSIRNLIGLLWFAGITFCCIFLTLKTTLNHYQSIEVSLEMLGFDRMPLGMNTLLGSFFQVLIPDATLIQTTAAVMALTLAVAFYLFLNYAWDTLDLGLEYSRCREEKDFSSGHEALRRIFKNVFACVALGGLLVIALLMDLELARFRIVGGALNLHTETHQLQPFTVLFESHALDNWLFPLAKKLTWGLCAVLFISIVALELAIGKMQDYWSRLVVSVAALYSAIALVDDPVYNQQVPETPPPPIFELEEEMNHTEIEPISACTEEQPVPVIGGTERVTLQQALADPASYFVDEANKVWLKSYYDQLKQGGAA